jgi:hypothetical protein
MIYGIFIGMVLIICGIISAWIPWYATAALGLAAIFALLIFWAISARSVQGKYSPVASTPGAVPATTQTTATPPAPATSTPAPQSQANISIAKKGLTFSWGYVALTVVLLALWAFFGRESTDNNQQSTQATYTPAPPAQQAAQFVPAPAPKPQQESQDTSGLPTFLLSEGHQNGPALGKFKRKGANFYNDSGEIEFTATDYAATPGFPEKEYIKGEGRKKGGETIPFRAIRVNG